jgi:hypothetical protein
MTEETTEAPRVVMTPELAQKLSTAVGEDIFGVLARVHAHVWRDQAGDGRPLVQGALIGMFTYMIGGGLTESQVRALMAEAMDSLLPQIIAGHLLEQAKKPEGAATPRATSSPRTSTG